MDNLEYSNDALSSKGLFYNKQITVYVEGKDDVLFWDKMFQISDVPAYIEDLGGKEELEKFINKIIDEDADFYIATDNDNSEFLDDVIVHDNIIRTYGYSIENSMYFHFDNIGRTICNMSRINTSLVEEFNTWLNSFTEHSYELIVYDITNNKHKYGVSVFGDNCCRFLVNRNSEHLSLERINEYFESIKDKFNIEHITSVREELEQMDKHNWFLIKGHFITNALLNFIKNTIRRLSGSNVMVTLDFLYSITIDCFNDWQNKNDLRLVVNEIQKINIE